MKLNIVSCISSKDLITFYFQSNVYNDLYCNYYIISSNFTRRVLKTLFFFRFKNHPKYIFIDEASILRDSGINDFDSLVLKCNVKLYKKRNWYKQQFLKYEIRKLIQSDYLIIDGDTFPTNIDNILKIGQFTRYINSYCEVHYPYEQLYNKLLQKSGQCEYNFVCEVFYINYDRLNELIEKIEINSISYIEAILKNSLHECGFSEYQTYGRYEYENTSEMNYEIFNTIRHYGKQKLPWQKISEKNVKFVSFETSDCPNGIRKLLFYLFYKPIILIFRILKL
jgi:hypothetical protein